MGFLSLERTQGLPDCATGQQALLGAQSICLVRTQTSRITRSTFRMQCEGFRYALGLVWVSAGCDGEDPQSSYAQHMLAASQILLVGRCW
jgi:hypothetical protein